MARGEEKSKKNSQSKAQDIAGPQSVEVIIVGASLAGIVAATELQTRNPATQILVLESEDRGGGRFFSGLHLVPEVPARKWGLGISPKEFGSIKVRWDRKWVDPDQVDWGDKDWVNHLPQWKLLSAPGLRSFESAPESSVGVAVKYKSPVKSISRLTESANTLWQLETPTAVYLAKNVIWAAGMVAFQNAFGKHESQTFMGANPEYSQIAADFRSGLALNWEFNSEFALEEGFPQDNVWALPLRHEGELLLLVGALFARLQSNGETVYDLRCYLHVENDMLVEPKVIATLQKAIKRTLKNVIIAGIEIKESWVVSNRILGAELGTPWIFKNHSQEGIEFVGEETLGSRLSGFSGVIGALESIRSLELLKKGPETELPGEEIPKQIMPEETEEA
jgi:hypothetical protein